jgi:hypothetical protein
MTPELEWRMWKQLGAAFSVDKFIFTPIFSELSTVNRIEQYASMEVALEHCRGHRVFLEEKGRTSVDQIPKGDVSLILGNTSLGNLHLAGDGESYRICSPKSVCLYGINAAAIALAIRYGQ